MNMTRTGFLVAAIFAAATAAAFAASPLASHKLDSVQLESSLSGAGSGAGETNFGSLVADAVRQTGQADIALVPADEIGEGTVPAGTVPVATIVQKLPYANDSGDTVMVMRLTGAQIRKAVERGVSRAPQSFNGFLQVSGLQVRYNDSAPDGKRVEALKSDAGDISPDKTYTVATTRTIADGGLGYFQIWDPGAAATNTGVSIADCLTNYLESHKVISGSLEGRIAKG